MSNAARRHHLPAQPGFWKVSEHMDDILASGVTPMDFEQAGARLQDARDAIGQVFIGQ